MKKSLAIFLIFLTSCTNCPPVVCHTWTPKELDQMRMEDEALPQDSIFHAVMKNYESICAR